MNRWNKDGQGNIRVSPIIGWKTATLINQNSDVFLRLEFGVDHDLEQVSALQFGLTALQAKALGEQLASHGDKLAGIVKVIK
ncbi:MULTISPECIES: hypothetical protein [Ensifer]|jgi:hypothetical protein|uniref:Uncharacterized protein n=1 Tax=Ensifer canadensis TaxID=555315 RepID=A0AAW4FN92_9HYPH|nr:MULTISPECIES: hypothetical protein [Ensifer]KQW34867.1 hypothetical protein ASD02_16685 [Ensifer sp. Root1252]KQW55638.1 hypothetical protein ASD03_18970 [Ensifer sp. Root127]KQY76960.1 hypothetical protein ASD52_23460 [Ensifer sp. Root142]KRC57191.1 hypothetical protein ASE32_20000 [Ensifer sp. Root231]KRC87686.1 hypothetical protein ASE47_14155 [Ensifer sp. Root258]